MPITEWLAGNAGWVVAIATLALTIKRDHGASKVDHDSSGSATAVGVCYHVYVVRVEGVR